MYPSLVFLFLSLVLIVGVVNLLRRGSTDDFLVAGRRSRTMGTGGSLAATIVGGTSTVGLAGLAYQRGLSGAWWLLVGVVWLSVLLVFVPRVKQHNVSTLPELIGIWYGPSVRKISSVLIVFSWMGIIGAQANAAGTLLAQVYGGVPWVWTVIFGVVFIVYTAAGGQVSVIRTDLIQLMIIIVSVAAACAVGLARSGGLAGMAEALDPSFLAFVPAPTLSAPTPSAPSFALGDLLLLLVVVGTTYLIGPDVLSRLFCSSSVRSARRAVAVAIVVLIPLAFAICLCGMIARVQFPNGLPESAFPLLILKTLPPALGLLTVFRLLSAFLSSADTTLLTVSSICTVDILERRPVSVRTLRAVPLIAGAVSVVIGIASGGVIRTLLLSYSVFSGGLAVPIVAGLAGVPLSRPGQSVPFSSEVLPRLWARSSAVIPW